MDIDDLSETEDWLLEGDFSLDDADMAELTSDLPAGWDEVDTDIGGDVMQDFESNFDTNPFEPGSDLNTFDDLDFGDFGDSFDLDF